MFGPPNAYIDAKVGLNELPTADEGAGGRLNKPDGPLLCSLSCLLSSWM